MWFWILVGWTHKLSSNQTPCLISQGLYQITSTRSRRELLSIQPTHYLLRWLDSLLVFPQCSQTWFSHLEEPLHPHRWCCTAQGSSQDYQTMVLFLEEFHRFKTFQEVIEEGCYLLTWIRIWFQVLRLIEYRTNYVKRLRWRRILKVPSLKK